MTFLCLQSPNHQAWGTNSVSLYINISISIRTLILCLFFQENMETETESLEEGLITTKSSVNCRDESASDSKATPIFVLSSMVALCGSLTIGCSVSTTKLSCYMWNNDLSHLVLLYLYHYCFAVRILITSWIWNYGRLGSLCCSCKFHCTNKFIFYDK